MADETTTETTQTSEGEGTKTQETTQTSESSKTTADTTTQQSTTSTTEEKTDGTKATEQTKTDALPKVPDAYTLTAPEGAALDAAGVEMFTPLFKEAGLSNELAQKLVNAQATYQAQLAAKQSETWLAEAKADKEIGGDKFDAASKNAQAAFAKFATPELKQFMETTGLGNHPGLLRMFAKIGAASQEDSTFIKGAGGAGEKSAAETLYPNQA
jgi:hypothetical protein